MSTSLSEVISAGGFDLTKVEDAKWLVAQVNQFEDMIEAAENLIEEAEEDE